MSSFDWRAVVDIVKKEFPSYIPVPSRNEIGDYKVLNFVCLEEGKESSAHPRFCYYGKEDDILSEDRYVIRKPKATVNNLWAYNESTKKRSPEASTRTGGCRGSPEKVILSTLNLGTISEHKYNLKEIEDWLKRKPSLKYHAAEKAHGGNLYIIYSAIMAEKLVITEGNEETGVKERVYTPVADLRQSQEVVGFPVGFKLAKVQISTYTYGTISGVQAYSWKE